MIHIVVATSHLSAILGYRRGHQFNAVLRRTLEPLVGMPIRTVNTPADLSGVTVFEVLEDFHNRASVLLRAEPAEAMTTQRNEIMRVGRQEYHYPDFEANIDDACRSVAIHGLFPHGTLTSRGTQAFLPEFSIGVCCFGFFARSHTSIQVRVADIRSDLPEKCPTFTRGAYLESSDETEVCGAIEEVIALQERLAEQINPYGTVTGIYLEVRKLLDRLSRESPRVQETERRVAAFFRQELDRTIENLWVHRAYHDLQRLECHLCDSVLEAYNRADRYWTSLRDKVGSGAADSMLFEMEYGRNPGDEYLVIDAIAHGFQGHRSLRRDNPEVPALGNHRLLAGKATRQGIGKPVVSGLFPISLWRLMESSVQHFILNAAEKVGAEQCPPLYPNMPSEADMQQLYGAASCSRATCRSRSGRRSSRTR
jgi:hypothetical protein